MRSAIDEGVRRHEAISSAYNVRAQVPLRRGIGGKVVTLAKVMTLVGGQTRSGT